MRRLTTILTSPWLYAGWALFVVAALGTTCLIDPYVFAFATLIVAWACVPVGLAGLSLALFSSRASRRARASIVLAVVLAGAAVLAAFAFLSTFRWA
jgi:NADH:ubiquinone oxidoreductase subunit K